VQVTLKTSTATVALFGGAHHLDRRALDLIEAANVGSDDELLTTPQVAVWLQTSPEWLEIGRGRGWGPRYLRLSPRRIRYRRGDVKTWLKERAFRLTGEYADPEAPRQGRKPGSRVIDGKVLAPEEAAEPTRGFREVAAARLENEAGDAS
jgi:hypothetical protein